jgi:predicted acyl esterase
MDVGAYETVKLFEFQQHHPDQYLIMAPTEHCKMLATSPDARLGQRPMGDTRFPYDEIIISWFDRFLCDDSDAWRPMPKVQVFLMGACTWLVNESWPLPETEPRTLCLAGGVRQHALGRRRPGVSRARAAGTDKSSLTRTTPCNRWAATSRPIPRSASISGRSSAGQTCSSTARPCWPNRWQSSASISAELYVSADVEDAECSSSS